MRLAAQSGYPMFEFIRTHRRVTMFLLFLLVVPSFVFFGLESYTSMSTRDTELASVKGEAVTAQEFNRVHANQLEQYRAMLGGQFDPALVDTPQVRQRLLDQLIDQRVVAAAAVEGRYSVSDETLRRTIATIPAVQVDGRFSAERYREALAAQGLTPAMFEAGLRRDLATAQVLEPVGVSSYVPEVVLASVQAALSEQRTLRLRAFSADDFRKDITVSDADVKTWYDANGKELEVPEHVSAEYVVLDEAVATQGITVSDADIADYYKNNASRFGREERRRASHILIEVPASADQATRDAARAKADALAKEAAANPDSFAELARKNSQDSGSAASGGDLGWISRNMLVEPVEKAIYGLKQGEVSGVVQSNFGFHVIRLTELQAADVKPLADVREQIVTEIRKQQAGTRFSELAKQFTDAAGQGDSLQPAADALGVQVRKASGITRTGLLDAADTGADAASASKDVNLLNDPRVREALFSQEVLRDKQNSRVMELSAGQLVAVRAGALTPAQVPPLEKVSASIRDRLVDERAGEAARKAGEAALASLKAAPAGDAPEGFGQPVTVSRQDPGALSREALEAVMRLPSATLPAYAGAADGGNFVITRLEKVEAGTVTPQQQAALRQQISQAWGQAEQQAVVQLLRQRYDVRVLPAAKAAVEGEAQAN